MTGLKLADSPCMAKRRDSDETAHGVHTVSVRSIDASLHPQNRRTLYRRTVMQEESVQRVSHGRSEYLVV